MIVVPERDVRLDDAAVLFEKHILRAVNHDVRHALFFEQQFERTETKGLVQHFFNQAFPLGTVQQRILGVTEMFHHHADFASQGIALQF